MNIENLSFENKTGIITGVARGIGKAIAAQFVNMGGRAVIVDVNEEQAKETAASVPNPLKKVTGYLKRYRAMVTSANRGAILDDEQF